MPRRSRHIPNPFRLELRRKRIEPVFMKKGTGLAMHVQISEEEPVPLLSFSLDFETVEEFKDFMVQIMNKAAEVWPNEPDFAEWFTHE